MEGTHFEVLADNGRGWSVQAVFDDGDAAKERANEIKATTKAIAVKVLRVGFDEARGEFVEVQVLYLGERRPDVPGKEDLVDSGPICESGSDLYGLSARRAIRRVLKTWLDQVGASPIELLHDAELFLKLDNAGTSLQGGVQRAAMAQARQTGQNVQARQRELYRVVDQAVASLRAVWRNDKRPRLENDDLDALAAKLSGDDEDLLLINVALTERLGKLKAGAEKLDFLLDMLGRSEAPHSIAALDNYLTDFVEDSVFMRRLLGEDAGLGEALLRGAALLSGGGSAIPGLPEQYLGFIRKLNDGLLPSCRKTLLRRVMMTLGSQHSLAVGGPLDEIRFNTRLHDALRRPDGGFVGGEEMKEAFLARSERFVTPDAIGRITDGMEHPAERIGALLDMAPGIYGERNQRRLGEYLLAIIEQPNNWRQFVEGDEPAVQRMRRLVGLQQRVVAAGFPEFQAARAAQALDGMCAQVMEAEKILDRLVSRAPGRAAACLALLQLCSSGTFTQGQAIGRARDMVTRLLRSSGMIEELLEDADGPDEKKRRLMELHDLIDRAEIPNSAAAAALAVALG